MSQQGVMSAKIFFSRVFATLREIGARFGLKDSGVSEASRRVSDKLAKNEALRLVVEKLRTELVL